MYVDQFLKIKKNFSSFDSHGCFCRIQRYYESGLLQKLKEPYWPNEEKVFISKFKGRSLKLSDTTGIFYLYGALIIIVMLVLTAEILYYRFNSNIGEYNV